MMAEDRFRPMPLGSMTLNPYHNRGLLKSSLTSVGE